MSNRRVITEFVVLIADGWSNHVPEVLAAVQSRGGEVTSVDQENGILEGRIESLDLPRLRQLRCVRRIVEGTSFIARRFEGAPGHGGGTCRRGRARLRRQTPAPRLSRVRDAHRPTRLPTDIKPAQRMRVRLPASPAIRNRVEPAARRFGGLDLSQRLTWTADDRPLRDKPHGRRSIPVGVRLAYVLISVLGIVIAAHQPSAGAALAALAAVAALGLCRFRLLRHTCTALALCIVFSTLILQRSLAWTDVVSGLAAFLIAGIAAEAIGDAREC